MAQLLNVIPGDSGAIKEVSLRCSQAELRKYMEYVTQRSYVPEMSFWDWLFWVETSTHEENEIFFHRVAGGRSFVYETRSGHQIHAYLLPEQEEEWEVFLVPNPRKPSKFFIYDSISFFKLMDDETKELIGPIVYD